MILDIRILQALKERKRYETLYSYLPKERIDNQTSTLLQWYGKYFDKYPDVETVEPDALMSLITLKGNYDASRLTLYKTLIDKIKVTLSVDEINVTIDSIEELRYTAQAGMILARYESQEEIDVVHELAILTETTKQRKKSIAQSTWADGDVMDYINQMSDDYGYKFDWLSDKHNEALRGAVSGDNVALAMPTDKGKTSLLCRAAVKIAKQHKERLGDGREPVFRPVLFLVNEGTAEKITPRIYQTALNVDMNGLRALGSEGIKANYDRELGRRDAIRLVNIHGMTSAQVYRIIEAHNPFCVITDMTGRIKTPQAQGANDTQQLEIVWDTFRQFGAMNNFFHIGTVQISAEGNGIPYPPLTALQGSKTGIQTTLDLAIFVGVNDSNPDASTFRYMATPKNKLAKVGYPSNTQVAMVFEPHKNTWLAY